MPTINQLVRKPRFLQRNADFGRFLLHFLAASSVFLSSAQQNRPFFGHGAAVFTVKPVKSAVCYRLNGGKRRFFGGEPYLFQVCLSRDVVYNLPGLTSGISRVRVTVKFGSKIIKIPETEE